MGFPRLAMCPPPLNGHGAPLRQIEASAGPSGHRADRRMAVLAHTLCTLKVF